VPPAAVINTADILADAPAWLHTTNLATDNMVLFIVDNIEDDNVNGNGVK